MVWENSWNVTKWPKVMEFCDQSWNFINFAPKLCHILFVFGHHQESKQRSRKSAFSGVFHKISRIQNREEKWLWKNIFVKFVGTLMKLGTVNDCPGEDTVVGDS